MNSDEGKNVSKNKNKNLMESNLSVCIFLSLIMTIIGCIIKLNNYSFFILLFVLYLLIFIYRIILDFLCKIKLKKNLLTEEYIICNTKIILLITLIVPIFISAILSIDIAGLVPDLLFLFLCSYIIIFHFSRKIYITNRRLIVFFLFDFNNNFQFLNSEEILFENILSISRDVTSIVGGYELVINDKNDKYFRIVGIKNLKKLKQIIENLV